MITTASMGYSKNHQFSQVLLDTALRGADTCTEKFREMEDVVRQARVVTQEVDNMEGFYVALVEELKYEKKMIGSREPINNFSLELLKKTRLSIQLLTTTTTLRKRNSRIKSETV